MEFKKAIERFFLTESSKKRIETEPYSAHSQRKHFHSIKYFDFALEERLWERFDFTNEWNNLGYGRISQDDSKWSISNFDIGRDGFSKIIAIVCDEADNFLCTYAGIKESNGVATLWYNREVGPIDGVDIAVIEDFLLNYKTGMFESIPVLSEIPYGYESAVTMRIDCDEHIASGRDLFELYKKMGVPFSMAIKTSLDFNEINKKLMLNVIDAGGAIVSHSHTHAPNWGGSRENAMWEAQTARKRLKEVLPKKYSYDWVVSPFHQNPTYALQGLQDAGIKGFIGGIIKNDPEYLLGRAGYVPYVKNIITHSQQCMLHGDCYHSAGNSIEVYKKSFRNHYKTKTFFGFLDHPFSNYKYGWTSEEERLLAHKEFLNYIKSFKYIWFANLIDSMNFLWVKANTRIWIKDGKLEGLLPLHNYNVPDLNLNWKGSSFRISSQSGHNFFLK